MRRQTGITFIEVLILAAILGILGSVVMSIITDNKLRDVQSRAPQPKEVHYVFCKDDTGEIHQASGDHISVKNASVLVYKDGKQTHLFANMDCWTETETTVAPPIPETNQVIYGK